MKYNGKRKVDLDVLKARIVVRYKRYLADRSERNLIPLFKDVKENMTAILHSMRVFNEDVIDTLTADGLWRFFRESPEIDGNINNLIFQIIKNLYFTYNSNRDKRKRNISSESALQMVSLFKKSGKYIDYEGIVDELIERNIKKYPLIDVFLKEDMPITEMMKTYEVTHQSLTKMYNKIKKDCSEIDFS